MRKEEIINKIEVIEKKLSEIEKTLIRLLHPAGVDNADLH